MRHWLLNNNNARKGSQQVSDAQCENVIDDTQSIQQLDVNGTIIYSYSMMVLLLLLLFILSVAYARSWEQQQQQQQQQ